MAEREAVHVVAENVVGDILTRTAQVKARVTRVRDNARLEGLDIRFVTGGKKIPLSSSITDTEGRAECLASGDINPILWEDALASGYDAVFDGNEECKPTQGHGTITPGVG